MRRDIILAIIAKYISHGMLFILLHVFEVSADLALWIIHLGMGIYGVSVAYSLIYFAARNLNRLTVAGCLIGLLALGYLVSLALEAPLGVPLFVVLAIIVAVEGGLQVLNTYTGYV